MNIPQSCDLLIRDTSYLTPDMEVKHHVAIAIQSGRILNIIPDAQAACFQPSNSICGKGKLWMPGLTDGHMHTGQQLLKGKILDELPMIWTRIMLPFESTLTPEKMRLSAQLASLEMIRSGTSSFVDAGSYFMEEAAKVYLSSGLRGALSYSTMDTPNLPDPIRDTAQSAIQKTDSLFRSFHKQGRLKVYYSLRSLISCSSDLIRMASDRAQEQGTFLQAHMNEYPNEINFFLEHYQMRPFEYLESIGALSDSFLAAHCLFLSPHEIELIRKHDVRVVHCPFSNCGKGIPQTPSLLEQHISVGLGSDGTAHGGLSLWNEMKIFRSVMNASFGVSSSNPRIMPAATILRMVTQNGSHILDEDNIGSLAPGKDADMISIQINQPHFLPAQNLTNLLLESATAHDVTDMMVQGDWIMKDRQILTLDEEKILFEAEHLL